MRRAWEAIWRTGLLPVVAGVAGVLGLLWLVLVAAPPWFVHDRSLEGLKVQNEVRTTLLQGLGGAVLLVGAYFTYQQLANSRQQLQTAQQGQITERFTRAIDQLGDAQLDVRLGGIYALERIARDSPYDRSMIAEVLTAFVRGHSPWPPRLPGQYGADVPIGQLPDLEVRAADVQAALTVLGRRRPSVPPSRHLHLHSTDLRKADIPGAQLQGANLDGAQLQGAWLVRAKLQGATLAGAQISHAHLQGADLTDADLTDAQLQGASADRKTNWPEGFRWQAAGVLMKDKPGQEARQQ